MLLTMGERFEDLRKGRNLTLNELAKATKISRSALNKYEHNDFKDISPFSISTLAKFYGVTADYLMGLSDMENHSNAEIHKLHLSDKMLDLIFFANFQSFFTKNNFSVKNLKLTLAFFDQ